MGGGTGSVVRGKRGGWGLVGDGVGGSGGTGEVVVGERGRRAGGCGIERAPERAFRLPYSEVRQVCTHTPTRGRITHKYRGVNIHTVLFCRSSSWPQRGRVTPRFPSRGDEGASREGDVRDG